MYIYLLFIDPVAEIRKLAIGIGCIERCGALFVGVEVFAYDIQEVVLLVAGEHCTREVVGIWAIAKAQIELFVLRIDAHIAMLVGV